jgi:uncharacterized protein
MTISDQVGVEKARTGRLVARVAALATAPVKGLRLQSRETLELDRLGAVDDRRFFLINESDRMVNSRRVRKLSAVLARYDPERRWLSMTFPYGEIVEAEVELMNAITPRFFATELPATIVDGPWAAALSAYTKRDLRLVMVAPDSPGTDRGHKGTVSLISRASVTRLERFAGHAVDARRFRMLIEADGIEAHAEDAWIGRRLQIGTALIRFNGNIGRCIVTGLDPDTGRGDMPTLELLRQYRSGLSATEPLPFGVYGEVLVPGILRRGDPVLLID